MVEFDGIGSTTKEGVSGLQWLYYLEGREKLLKVMIGFDFDVPVTFPLYFDIITALCLFTRDKEALTLLKASGKLCPMNISYCLFSNVYIPHMYE